jgi:hypothetical protein
MNVEAHELTGVVLTDIVRTMKRLIANARCSRPKSTPFKEAKDFTKLKFN